jgi:hypothetical protein
MTALSPTADEMQIVPVKIYFEGSMSRDLGDADIEFCEIRYLVTGEKSYKQALSLYQVNWGMSYSEDTYEKLCELEKQKNLKRQDSLSPERELIAAFQLLSRGAGVTYKHFDNGEPFLLYNLADSYHIGYSRDLRDVSRMENGQEIFLQEPQLSEFKLCHQHKNNVESMLARHPVSYVQTAELKAVQLRMRQ